MHQTKKQLELQIYYNMYLLPGDMILAERGFTISDYSGLVCAEVKIPASTVGKAQLEEKDVY